MSFANVAPEMFALMVPSDVTTIPSDAVRLRIVSPTRSETWSSVGLPALLLELQRVGQLLRRRVRVGRDRDHLALGRHQDIITRRDAHQSRGGVLDEALCGHKLPGLEIRKGDAGVKHHVHEREVGHGSSRVARAAQRLSQRIGALVLQLPPETEGHRAVRRRRVQLEKSATHDPRHVDQQQAHGVHAHDRDVVVSDARSLPLRDQTRQHRRELGGGIGHDGAVVSVELIHSFTVRRFSNRIQNSGRGRAVRLMYQKLKSSSSMAIVYICINVSFE